MTNSIYGVSTPVTSYHQNSQENRTVAKPTLNKFKPRKIRGLREEIEKWRREGWFSFLAPWSSAEIRSKPIHKTSSAQNRENEQGREKS